jgi:hypothetical protein
MNTLKCVCFALVALLSLGCPVRSIFPLFNEKDLMLNKNLVGTWIGKDALLKIDQSGEKDYRGTFIETDEPGKNGKSTSYAVLAGKVGKYWFLDSTPDSDPKDHHLLKSHVISKVQLEGDGLSMSSLEGDRLRELIDAGTLKVSHVRRNNEIILTASPEELQKLVLQLADDEKAFPESPQWKRKN